MRKFAGKCLALLLALLMPLTSMPVSLAESYTSEPFNVNVETPSREDVIAAAVADNVSSGAYVELYSAVAESATVSTGAEFTYSVGYALNAAPTYRNDQGDMVPAYSQYEGVAITVTVPDGIMLLDYTPTSENTYEISLGNQPITGGAGQTLSLRARMTGNGTVPNDTPYGKLGVEIEAGVAGSQTPFSYALPDARNKSAVTSEAKGEWAIEKTRVGTPSVNGEEVTLTWQIKIGKVAGEAISSVNSVYQTEGALNFVDGSFSLTDTLPTITGKDGVEYKPLRSTLSADGMTAVKGSAGQTELTTQYYDTIALSAGGVAADFQTPYYTEYTVTATYDRDAFVLPFGETTEVSYENAAKLQYRLVGQDANAPSATVPGQYGIETEGGAITVFEQLRIGTNGDEVEYNTFYANLFPNGATFEIYKADEDGNATGTAVATLSVTNEDGATTAALAPGKYIVRQTKAPKDSQMPAEEGRAQIVTVTSGGKATATFTNVVPNYGRLELDKKNASDTAMANVTFTLTSTTDSSKYTLTTGDNGYGVVALPKGTYTLTEATPEGYAPMKAQTVTIEEGKTTSLTGDKAIVNYAATGTLTITKLLAEYAGQTEEKGAVPVTDEVSDATFTFYIYQDTSENVSAEGEAFETATIEAGKSSTTVSLPVADENGNPYYYIVTEVDDKAPRFTYDSKSVSFDFEGEEAGTYTTTASATFTNVLKSKLSIKKVEEVLGGTLNNMKGITFEVRSGSAKGTVVATITTGEDGVATTAPLLIKDASGKAIDYYVVETNVAADYTTVYPEDSNAEDNAWGPINLSFAETTDKTSTPVVNRKHETSLTVKKTDQSGAAIEGATFTVQNSKNEYAAINGTEIVWQVAESKLTTGANGQIVLSGIPIGTYTVTETGVPKGYLSTGTVTGADTFSQTPTLSGEVTLETLESETITFKNDKKPVLQFTKSVSGGTASGNFTFELYAANADGTAPRGNSLGSATVAAGGTASFTVDTAGKYFLKETSWPVGVIAPSILHKQSGEGVYVSGTDVYYGPYELKNNETTKATIANTANTGSLAITKTDAKTNSALAGATFTVSVDVSDWSEELIALLPNGFKKGEGNTYAMTTSATDANGKVTVSGLPLYNGTTAISYTVTEAAAPANYIKSAQTETATPATAANYAASCAFTNAPMAKVVVTKTYFKQWEADSQNRIDYALDGAQIAIFEEVNRALAQVGATQTTGADGTVTFEGLDGTKTYYVFELSNTKNLGAEGGKSLAGDVSKIIGQSASDATNAYYSATLNLAEEDDNQAEAKLSNVETYVQLTLEKWYYPEDSAGNDISQEKTLLDRAKFHLYRCTLDEYEKAGRSIEELVDSAAGMEAYRVSDYVYESGVSNNAGRGMVVTGSLEGGYVYWFNEFEAPAGFVTPEWPASLSVVFVPDDAVQGNEISYEGKTSAAGSMENDPVQGPGTIRYLQVMVDKVARPKDAADGSKDEPLANTTFELWLTDSTYTKRVERVAKFTTGVDVPEGTDYLPGRGVSESIQMHKLYDEYGGEEKGNYVTRVAGELDGTVQHYEYAAHFVLVETQWPANTTPITYNYPLDIRTNPSNDADASESVTLDVTYTKQGEGPIVNRLEKKVTVAIQKVGYAANASATTWPLAGAEITIYSDEARTKEVASGATGADGLVYFTLDPLTTYYWKETKVPNGYEAVAPQDGYSFRTPGYSSEGATEIEPIVTVKNVQYRKVSLAKKDGENYVAATFELQQNGTAVNVWQKDAATGAFTEAGTSVTTTTAGPAEFYLPAGTYTVVETHVGDRALFPAEKSNFALINDNETFTLGATDAVKELSFVNPGTGSLTLTKTDDAGTAMAGVQFTLSFKAFAAADVASTTLPAPSAVTRDVKAQTGVDVSTTDLTTEDNGQISLSGLVPGWYKLAEASNDANANYVLADAVVIKVTASNFGTAIDGASATVVNKRKGYLNVEKAYEGGFADGFSAASNAVTFGVYTNANCTGEPVATFTITGEGAATPVALDPGTYYVKETTTGAWYTNYAVDYTAEVSGRSDVAKTWLPEAGGAVQVTVASADTEENAVMVSFTNVGYLADLAFNKVGVQGESSEPLAGAQFVLYYGSGDAALYYNGNGAWGAEAQAAKYASGADGRVTIADIQLPYAVVSASADMSGTYSIKEVVTPEAYTAPETDAQVALAPGDNNTSLTGDSAIVNERGVVITITKYNKPYAVTEGRGTLDGAEFTLYHMSESGSVKETFPAQTTKNGQVQFVNLPQLKDGEYYAIQETAIPDGYVEDSLEVYNGATLIAADANGYYKVATDVDVNIDAYNTPYGKIAILKYDYVNHSKLPVGGLFTATNDANAEIDYSATLRTAQSGDESLLAGGYQLSGNHYVKDGISYSVAYMNDVEPGTYTVVEEESPDGYLYTPDSTADDPWHTTQSVTVPEDGSTAVVVFANLPNPTSLSVNIEKAGEYKGEGDLLGEEYQAIEFTLSDFTQGTELPLEDATITDETITFLDAAGNEVENVDWYVASVTIGAARYEATALYDTPSTATIFATVNGSRTVSLASAQTISFDAGACKAVEIDYHNGSAATEGLDAGFKADPIVITIMARQAGGTETVPVAKVSNKASVSMTYNFGVVGAESDSETRTKTDDATASVEIAEAPELPKASLAKTSKVKDENGNEVTGETAVVGQTIEYTITLTGQSEPGMQDPILADILPAGLNVVEVTAEAATLTDVTAQYAGQNVWATAKGELGQGETFTLTIEAEVMPAALAGLNGEGNQITNTAYAFNNVTVPQSTQNEHGSSFTDAAGNVPGVSVPEAFAGISTGSGMALSDEANNNLTSASGVRINKLIKLADTAWVGAEALLTAEAGETVTYQVEVTNNGGTTVTNLRILDVLPYKGDGRGSAWGPTLSGSVSGATDIRYSTGRPAETAATFEAGFADWSTGAAGANAFVAIVPELGAGETVTLTYSAVVPEDPAAEDYYQLAINRAYCVYDNGPSTPLSSADTKVTITPPSVALGDRVWVDENANGIQDEGETKVPGGNTTFTLVSYMEGVPVGSATDVAENGIYGFAELTPAAPQDSAAEYFDSGDVDYTSLMGSARATYQLSVTVPDGYRITTPSKTTVEARSNSDSDFALTGETTKFYIPAGTDDLTHDVGLIRERDLTIAKKGTNGLNVANATFAIYGPYYEVPSAISADELVGAITTGQDGRAVFTSGEKSYLNAYAYYVVVETSTPANYSAANLTASGNVVNATVTGEGIENGNYFVLAPFAGEGMTGAAADAVTVTNEYKATGQLTITGDKTLVGQALAANQFSFELSSTDDADFAKQTVSNDADGNFAFPAIEYTYADVQFLASKDDHAYHYTVKEVTPEKDEDGIAYDRKVYTITVKLSDDDGDGKITVSATVSDGTTSSSNDNGAASVSFTNAAQGSLSVSKTVESNVASDNGKVFSFTLTLTNDAVNVNGTYTATLSGGTSSTVTIENGTGTFTLQDGQTITIGGIPNGTAYTVIEKDYKQEGFITTSENASGSIATGGTATASFTNTHEAGGLTVQKLTDGNGDDEGKLFSFTVTLEHATLPLNNTYGDVPFTNVPKAEGETGYKATATFTLKGGETKALTGIPAGTKYTVTEQDYTAEGYVTNILTNNATGEITHGGNPTVTFKNTRKVGGLTVSKTVAGNDFDANKAFDITVTLTAPANVNLVGSYAGAQSGSINVAATSAGASWTETFSLKNGESIEFTGLPENTTYEVSEADYAAEGYVKTVSGAEEGSIKAEATAAVAYTNTRDTGDLVITKTVTGSGREEDKLFDFTVTLKNATVDLNKTFGDVTFSPVTEGDAHEVQATFALKHGESKTITGIPAGTEYVVTEADYNADGYTVTKTGDTGTIAVEEGTATRPTFTAAFTNNRDVGNLQLTKLVTGSAFELGAPNAPYSYMIAFELTPPAGMSLEDSYYAMQGSSGTTYLLERYETLYTWDGTVYISQLGIAPDETYTIYDLPAGTTYKVYELYKDTDKGETYPTYYDDLGFEEPVFTSGGITATGSISGTIPGTEGANTVAVIVTNERNAGSLSVEKIVEGTGAQPEKVFTFTLQLTHIDGVKLEGKYPATINGTDTTVAVDADGETTFTLKGGETITIKGIPDGTTYEVTEASYTADGYTVEKTGEEGTIADGTTAEATFTNTRNVGGLTVTKKTVGNGLEEPGVRTTFDITVTLTPKAGVNLVGTVNGTALPADGTVTEGVWSKTFTLAADESVTFTGLPEGTTYTVSEEDYTAQGFVTTITPQTGSIEVEDGATEAPTVDVTVTNTRNVGGLTIAKAVTGSGSSASDTFTFRFELENETVNVDGTYNITYSGEANQPTTLVVSGGTAQITLHGGQTAFIDGIPLGTTYTVTELASDGTDAVKDATDANGYVLTTDNGQTGTIASTEGAYQASFNNDRKVGSLTVTKETEGNGLEEGYPNTHETYAITVNFTAPTGVTLTGTWTQGANSGNVTATQTFELASDESVVFTGLPAGTTYTISEADYTSDGYEVAVISPTTGTIPGEEGANSVAATVTNERNTGSLSVEKIVEGTGAEAEKEFAFTLQLTNAGVTLEGAYPADINGTDTTVAVDASGKATFKLKDGETITINGIPDGTTYEVLEQDYSANGYETTSTLDSGEIIDGETAQAKFTNHRDVGSLKITKEVAGNGEDAPNALTEFEVTVELTPPQGVTLVGTWEQGEESGNVAASNTFTLTDGESVELTGLPTGTSYTITEADYAANGYITDIDTASGEITDGALRATVLNTMNVGDLSVLKTVNGSGAETDREFSFTLTLINEAGVTVDNTYETSEGTLTVTGGKATFSLKGGESLSIYGIPEGTDYTVTEADPAEYGYLITATSGEEGVIGTGMSSATFTNTRDIGELSIEKKVTGALGETDKAFAFTLELTPSGNGIGVDGTYDATLYTAGQETSTTVTVANGIANFNLTHDQRLVIHEIPAGATYAVSEESYALEGYQTSASSETGTIPATGSMPVATFTNTRNGGSLRIVKNFAGNAAIPGDTFAFTIRLGRLDGVNVDGTYNALRNGVAEPITFTGGVATVWLGSGDTFEILGILSGTDYAVSEDIPVDSGYIGQGENETGTIPIDTAAQVTFTNARYTGNLTVRKTVAGNAAETDRSFRFTIFLRNPDGSNVNGTYPMTGRSAFITFVNGYASIRLAAGETATIHGILSGAYYSVSEDDANTDGYVTTASGVAGIIPAIASAQASFLNTRDVGTEETTTSRTVYKVWNDSDNADGLRPTEVVVYLLADGVSIDAATLSEANGWSARFDNLPVYNADGSAIEYQVVEAYTAEYYVRYQYAAAVINITNSHNPEDFVPDEPRDPNLLTLIEDYMVPLGGNVNMNEGDCFN